MTASSPTLLSTVRHYTFGTDGPTVDSMNVLKHDTWQRIRLTDATVTDIEEDGVVTSRIRLEGWVVKADGTKNKSRSYTEQVFNPPVERQWLDTLTTTQEQQS